MRRAIQARSISLDCIEQQHGAGTIPVWMSDHGKRIAWLVRLRSPPHGTHDVDIGGLDRPCSDRGRIRRASPNRDHDVAMWVLPSVVLHNSPIRQVLAHVEHCAGMMGEGRGREQQDSDRHCESQQRAAPDHARSMCCSVHTLP